jgi:hypothetical protein
MEYTFGVGGEQTKRPIEAGAPASDHWKRNLDSVQIRCAHTDTPRMSDPNVTLDEFKSGTSSALLGRIQDRGQTTRIIALENELRALIHSGAPVTVTGLSRTLTDYRIISMSEPRVSGQAGLTTFTLSLEEIRFSTVETVEAPAPRVERARRRRDDGGNQGGDADAVDREEGEDNRSLAARLRDSAAPLRDSIFGGRR